MQLTYLEAIGRGIVDEKATPRAQFSDTHPSDA